MSYLIIYLVLIKRSQCMRGWSIPNYFAMYVYYATVMAAYVCFVFVVRWDEYDT